MASPIPVPVLSKSGVQRDGTQFASDQYYDSLWCRWKNGYPRKMAGYQEINQLVNGIARAVNSLPQDDFLYLHAGSQSYLQRFLVDVNTYASSAAVDRTPAAFAASANNLWQMDQMYDVTNTTTYLLAHAAPNAADIANDTAGPVYYGDITDTAALTAISSSSVSGGIVVLAPYLFVFGSDGEVIQSVAGKPTDLTSAGSNVARPTAKKIVKGLPIRGGAGNAPAGLFWSLDSLIKASFVGGSPIFDYDTISAQISILAANSVIEYDGVFYWIGLGRFMLFNGIVQELPNNDNQDFFFNNLNWDQRNKIFAYRVERFGEIWWCWPKGDATEPNWALIYNINERCWYDTPLPNNGRGCAQNDVTFRFPIVGGVEMDAGGKSKLWLHEKDVNEVSGSPAMPLAIRSYFTTGHKTLIAPPAGGQPQNRGVKLSLLEPDFIQTGDLTVTPIVQANAKAALVEGDPQIIVETPTTSAEQVVGFQGKGVEGRILRLRFESNTLNGYYEMGNTLAHIEPADARVLGAVE